MKAIDNRTRKTVLAVDVGGTNTSCAIVEAAEGRLDVRFERRYSTKAEPSLEAPLSRFVDEAARLGAPRPGSLCVSGAGPVVDGSIALTNAPWGIDGRALERRFGLRTKVINDFSAIAWGVLLLDRGDASELLRLEAPGAAEPTDDGPIAVIGAGTGLGFGYALRDGPTRVYASEGGHVCLPVFDDESRRFSLWLEGRYGCAAGAEAGVSGQGIAHIFAFMAQEGASHSAAVKAILDAAEDQRPAMVAEGAAKGDELCARAMRMFVGLYARVAFDAAVTFLPSGGIYLAGGIAAKNLRWFTEDGLFMRRYAIAYREHAREIAARTPVYVVMDYSISIFGAANAAIHLEGGE